MLKRIEGIHPDVSLNGRGEVLFSLYFTDETTAVFLAAAPVPEPASVTLLAVSALMLVRRR